MTTTFEQQWQWWGDEGGMLLRVRRDGRGVVFETCSSDGTAAGTVVVSSVTLASFRCEQLQRWLNPPDEVSPREGSSWGAGANPCNLKEK